MSGSRGSGALAVGGPHRSIVAAVLGGSLAVQLALATPIGAAVLHGSHAEHPVAVAAHAHHPDVAAADRRPGGAPEPGSMPCGEGGQCGWGLMTCDGAGTCLPLQILPADLPADLGSVSGPPPKPRHLTEPTSTLRLLEGPPPRA